MFDRYSYSNDQYPNRLHLPHETLLTEQRQFVIAGDRQPIPRYGHPSLLIRHRQERMRWVDLLGVLVTCSGSMVNLDSGCPACDSVTHMICTD